MGKKVTDRAFLAVSPRALAPVVLTCEHATNLLPEGIRLAAAERATLASHWGWDIGAWTLTRDLASRLKTTAIGGRWSRLYIELNRRADEASLVRAEVEGLALSFNSSTPHQEIERRLQTYHAPYHLEIDHQITRRVIRGIRPLIFAVHTFTPKLNGRRRSFDVGILFDRHASLAYKMARRLRQSSIRVRYNEPYSGKLGLMYSAERHGAHHDLPCLELEVNQRLFSDPNAVSRIAEAVTNGIRDIVPELG